MGNYLPLLFLKIWQHQRRNFEFIVCVVVSHVLSQSQVLNDSGNPGNPEVPGIRQYLYFAMHTKLTKDILYYTRNLYKPV